MWMISRKLYQPLKPQNFTGVNSLIELQCRDFRCFLWHHLNLNLPISNLFELCRNGNSNYAYITWHENFFIVSHITRNLLWVNMEIFVVCEKRVIFRLVGWFIWLFVTLMKGVPLNDCHMNKRNWILSLLIRENK